MITVKTFIFDFNGTVLDDIDHSLDCINTLLTKYHIREPLSLDEYRHIFTFPVIDYYRKAGFDFDVYSFEEIGREWIDLYYSHKEKTRLMDGYRDILRTLSFKDCRTVLISASQEDNLLQQCRELNIVDYFDAIRGIDNIYAGSKEAITKEYISGTDPEDCLFIGDTLHDLQVARAVGCRCCLIAKGHQAEDVLKKEHDYVVRDIREVKELCV
ncbi:MAG: HAD family hydrolase [Erysipelotrichaceae bacterium]|nr:HAD family hydrolase [Erysipelotrichaceae bacterium]